MLYPVKKSITRSLVVCLILCKSIVPSFAQSDFYSLTDTLNKVFTREALPGMSVMLVDSDKIIYQKSFGFADIKNNIRYDANTIQNIGSVSKSLISIAILKCVELKYFTLETDINTILPFKVVNPAHPGDVITVRQLTNHTSGVIDNPAIYPNSYKFYPALRSYDSALLEKIEGMGYQGKVKDTTIKQFFYNYLCEKGKYYSKDNFSANKAGEAYSYSNLGSALAAYLVEIKSGMSYANFTKRYILKPLKMDNSGWFINATNLKKYARLYFDQTADFPLYSLLTYPDGGLRTSANDLGKFLQAVIKGYLGDTALLKRTSFKQLFTPMFTTANAPKNINLQNRNKGVFWNLYGNGTIGLDGDDPGVSSYLFFNPATGKGGLFICNQYLDNKQPIVDLLVEATL